MHFPCLKRERRVETAVSGINVFNILTAAWLSFDTMTLQTTFYCKDTKCLQKGQTETSQLKCLARRWGWFQFPAFFNMILSTLLARPLFTACQRQLQPYKEIRNNAM